MSNFANAITPALFPAIGPVSFVAGNTTIAKVVVEPQLGAVATGFLPAFYGGSTVIDLTASSTDSVAKDVLLYAGTIATTQDTTNTGAMTTTTSTIPRTTGSFIADGWLVGNTAMMFAPVDTAPNVAVDGIACVVTGVTALTLTLNGTPIAALALAAGTRIVKVGQLFRATITANAGNTAAIPNVTLLANSMDSSIIKTERKLGPTNMLIAAMQATLSALPATISITGQLARY
jgi:hypothetical protein